MFAPDTMLGDIDVTTIPNSSEKAVLLPGASGENRISFSQLLTQVRWAQDHFGASMTWAEAVTQLRKDASVGPNQRDFNVNNWISNQLRKANAKNELTDGQTNLAELYLGVFSGEATHWHAPIQAKLDATPAAIRNTIQMALLNAYMAGEQGPFNRVMVLIEKTFGSPPRGANAAGAERAVNSAFGPGAPAPEFAGAMSDALAGLSGDEEGPF